jgi:hypothetical protein
MKINIAKIVVNIGVGKSGEPIERPKCITGINRQETYFPGAKENIGILAFICRFGISLL